MDLVLLRAFQRQVKFQCECVLLATEQLNAAIPKRDITAIFCALQALLSSAANISKALWSGRKTKNALASRAQLRASLHVPDASPLHPRTMRNHFDHYDERLDEWWKKSKGHSIADMNVMSRKAIQGLDDIDRLRAFDAQTGDVSFAGDDFNIHTIIDEVRRILPIVTQEANKVPWEIKPKQP
jgi:hypothetical protein